MDTPSAPTGPDKDEAQGHFRKVLQTYRASMSSDSIVGVHERIKSEIGPRLGSLVLDIGSAGVPDFESDAARTVISMDYVLESLLAARNTRVLNVAGDILNLPLKTGSVDGIIVQHVVHYLTDRPFEKAGESVRRALGEAYRVLEPGGRIFVVDSVVPRPIEIAERAAYGVSYPLLKALKRPAVFFLSFRRLRVYLAGAGFRAVHGRLIDWGDMSEASQTLFPNLRLPMKRLPVKCALLSAEKRAES